MFGWIVVLVACVGHSLVAAADERADIRWGIQWRSQLRIDGSSRVVVLGARRSLPVTVLASNTGSADMPIADPESALDFRVRVADAPIPVVFRCQSTIDYQEVTNGTTVRGARVPRAETMLTPEDGIQVHCSINRRDGAPFVTAIYVVDVVAVGWPDAHLRTLHWVLEIRDPRTDEEWKHLNLVEGNEHYRDAEYKEASGYFERAAAIDPGDPRVALDLFAAYDKLERYEDAVALLERTINLNRAGSDERFRALQSSLALAYAAVGDEGAAMRKLRVAGFTDEQAQRIISAGRAKRLRRLKEHR
jgi:hypothetical protein